MVVICLLLFFFTLALISYHKFVLGDEGIHICGKCFKLCGGRNKGEGVHSLHQLAVEGVGGEVMRWLMAEGKGCTSCFNAIRIYTDGIVLES